jgi:hypothetical protein
VPIAAPISQPGLAAALGVILALAGCSGCNDSWEGFKSQKWRFAAKFPSKVSEESHATFAEFQAVTERATFRLTTAKVSPLPAKEALAELVAMRDSSAASLHATLAESKNLQVQGEPAIEFTLSFAVEGEEMVSHTRYVRCGNRFHQLIVTAIADEEMEGDVHKFFDSFRVETE